MKLREALQQYVTAKETLEYFQVRNSGDYAELLVAKAFEGARNLSGVERGFDVVAPVYGKIEVRSRTLPRDGRRETRIRIEDQKWGYFDWLAGVIFEPNLVVHAGYLLPHDAVKVLASGTYPRFPLETAMAHQQCVDITSKLREAEASL